MHRIAIAAAAAALLSGVIHFSISRSSSNVPAGSVTSRTPTGERRTDALKEKADDALLAGSSWQRWPSLTDF